MQLKMTKSDYTTKSLVDRASTMVNEPKKYRLGAAKVVGAEQATMKSSEHELDGGFEK
jgi:hypothetical protein